MLRALLTGGDRRSIARAPQVLDMVLADRSRLSELAGLAADDDWLVRQRAVDLLEKLAHHRSDWVAPYKAVFIGPLADAEQS